MDKKKKYFEFKEPFYALIKAECEKEAVGIYTEEIVGECDEDEMYIPVMIPYNTALGKFAKVIYETMSEEENDTYKLSDLMKEFANPNNYILLIDGDLI